MASVIEYDLTNTTGCSDNPLSRLIVILKESLGDIKVKTKTNILPQMLAQLLGRKYGYLVEVLETSGDEITYLFKKQ